MKARAFILIILWSTLLVEPLSANLNIQSIYSSCSKKQEVKVSCCKSKCSQPKEKEDENDCGKNRCNPLMSCPTGNFYLFISSQVSIDFDLISKQKIVLIDDNRISKHLVECWHPPEII
jgi:hypothetical protein